MEQRLAKLRSFLPKLGVDAVFVSNPVNIRYLTGYPAEDAWFLVTPGLSYYITDFRYITHVRGSLKNPGIKIIQFESSVFQTVVKIVSDAKVKVLGFEENHCTFYQFSRLKSLSGNKIVLKGLSGAVEALRVVKDPGELSLLREAVRINLKGFKYIQRYIRPGVTEKDIFRKLENFSRTENVGFSFSPIIASGLNSAYPHARVSEREIQQNEPLLLDFGVERMGYKSDLTRMFFLGKMPRSFERYLSIIQKAQESAFKVIKAGVQASVVDTAARDLLKKRGVAQYFGHSLGHGVGMDIHEMPRLSAKSSEILLENMVITVEPGIYFDGRYGVRLEEMVLVTKNGCEVLSGYRNY